MSHFTVLVKISAANLNGNDIESVVEAMLAPYQENNMGDCPEEYLEFVDREDEMLDEYNTQTIERVRLEDGTFVFAHSFPGDIPKHLEVVNIPFKDIYSTFEEYASEYCRHKSRDEKENRYGYWANPNATWDWYEIGGRWSGLLPHKNGKGVDFCTVADLDRDQIAKSTRENAEKFWAEFTNYRKTGVDPKFFGVRYEAYNIGLVQTLRDREPTVEERPRAFKWSDTTKIQDNRKDWWDIISDIDEDTFMEQYIDCFCPINTYAALDDNGWHAPGEMGWWGCSSESGEEQAQWDREFVKRFIKTADQNDVLVVVDCHI